VPVTDPTSARVLVYNIVVDQVAKFVGGISPKDVDVSRTFVDADPAGYNYSHGGYRQMCAAITDPIATTSGRAFTLPGPWQEQHLNDSIATFINAAALRLIAAPLSPAGVSAHAWAMGA
jgi:hypothetical protein